MPRTRFARNGDVDIAYQVHGDGPIDLVYIEGFTTHLDVTLELPAYRRFCEGLASFARLIRFDKRGMGLSDRTRAGTLEERMDDARAVMDAVGSERAAFLGVSEGGPMSMLFAATYPERTSSLILFGAEVRERKDEEWAWGESTPEEFEESLLTLRDRWGASGAFVDLIAPSLADEQSREWAMRLLVSSVTPGGAEAFIRMAYDIDVRQVLPVISVPTLIVHRTGDRVCDVGNGRYMADHIPGAKYVELPGDDHVPWAGGDEPLAEIREFLTGVREPAEPDRVLATVLFTDIVGSTELASRLGDRSWRDLVERHHAEVRRELERFRGREIDTAGDGFLASFDGPARAVRCARAIAEAMPSLGVQVRAGLHTGECQLQGNDLAGVTVHIGARIADLAEPEQVLVSGTVRDLVVGSNIAFHYRGIEALAGVPGEWRLFTVDENGAAGSGR